VTLELLTAVVVSAAALRDLDLALHDLECFVVSMLVYVEVQRSVEQLAL